MGPTVEVWRPGGRELVPLEGDRLTIGKDTSNDLAITEDRTVSRLHAVLERFPAGWCITDLGSSNGTFVNGERIWATQRLLHGDEVRVGQIRLILRHTEDHAASVTDTAIGPPALTGRERDVLRVLCRPLLARDLFTAPATVREIATELVVSEAAVKQHLSNLYVKFGLEDDEPNRRSRLANEALRRAAVTLADLQPDDD